MVSRRIGSTVIRSRKIKLLRTCVFLETIFTVSEKLSRSCSSSNWETCWGQWYLLESRKKSENSCSCKSATWLERFAVTNVLKICGRGFGWGNGRGLVRCDWISHHIPISFSFPEILHATCVSTNTVLIQALMHLRWLMHGSLCHQPIMKHYQSTWSRLAILLPTLISLHSTSCRCWCILWWGQENKVGDLGQTCGWGHSVLSQDLL